ncbi:sensor histidine kinase [Paenibacillus sp. PCH8]|uniref:sensor histidine kinase n=1 Tax=Paenibacillus sp. PCH8 TaxID=2066524 RepID=UPI000CF896FF|nr:sensor histidine kinase [Paenibacillus sp. PCH8]PQP81489.1 sensor histidine kinase [Paenibacillus sp. PCH8]
MRHKFWMFRKVNDIPLRSKFLLIYILSILLPVITINLFFYQRTSADIKIREQENLRKSIERAAGELLGMIDESVALSRIIAADDSLYEVLDRSYPSPVDYYNEYHAFLRDKLTRYMSANILEVRIYTDNDTIQTGSNYIVMNDKTAPLPGLKQLESTIGGILVVDYSEPSVFNPGRRISVIGKMDIYSSYATYAKYSKIDLDVNRVYSILNRETDSLQLRLVDSNNRIVVSSGERTEGDLSQTSENLISRESEDSAYTLEKSLGNLAYLQGWKLIGVADTRHLDRLLNEARNSILGLLAICTVVPSLLIYIILRSYHYRIRKLSRHMEKVRNERFDLIEIQEGSDEIGGLIRTFNMMIGKIHTLINDVYKLEIRQKDLELDQVRTELSMLQSQMNPHFLFNTLNALLVVSTKNGYTEVIEIIKSLSVLMRQLLSHSDNLIPLHEELQFTNLYLQIEKFRFGELFDYTFDVDPDVASLLIPRMSIQPLVENACKHGLQARKDGRQIKVTAKRIASELDIQVIDNGIGMDAGRLTELLRDVRSERPRNGEHVGLRNVYRRLELFYEGDAIFNLSSVPGNETMAGYRIPLSRLKPRK